VRAAAVVATRNRRISERNLHMLPHGRRSTILEQECLPPRT
jgi:hypothetical protein